MINYGELQYTDSEPQRLLDNAMETVRKYTEQRVAQACENWRRRDAILRRTLATVREYLLNDESDSGIAMIEVIDKVLGESACP